MSALGMMGGGMPPAGPAGPPPQSIQIGGGSPQPDTGKTDGDWETDLHDALGALRTLEADAQDHQEASVIATCIAQLRKLTAQRQAGAESALGVTPGQKAMSRAYPQGS